MALARQCRDHDRLPTPRGVALLDSPLCGDRIEIELDVNDGRIARLGYWVRGCVLCRASAAVLDTLALGACLQDIERVERQFARLLAEAGQVPEGWELLAAFAPLHGHRSRYGCAMLPLRALRAALGDATQRQPGSGALPNGGRQPARQGVSGAASMGNRPPAQDGPPMCSTLDVHQ
ncbi:iron-sulfur cluster assembly scaffold protein [Aromatoleum toluclasticum]|nr:iron-sulfur cluster assembly scaffold protein [Aromatoleum toluclasticum]